MVISRTWTRRTAEEVESCSHSEINLQMRRILKNPTLVLVFFRGENGCNLQALSNYETSEFIAASYAVGINNNFSILRTFLLSRSFQISTTFRRKHAQHR